MSPNFTAAILKALLRDPKYNEGIDETAREWIAQCPDSRDDAESQFAAELYGDMTKALAQRGDPFPDEIFLLALERVNWRRVARSLLNRFAPAEPAKLLKAVPSLN